MTPVSRVLGSLLLLCFSVASVNQAFSQSLRQPSNGLEFERAKSHSDECRECVFWAAPVGNAG